MRKSFTGDLVSDEFHGDHPRSTDGYQPSFVGELSALKAAHKVVRHGMETLPRRDPSGLFLMPDRSLAPHGS